MLQPEPGQVAFFPIIDGIEEFRLNINAYSPEYGRSNGGTIMVSGKSGSNELHGTIFEFFRNEALNAKNYFAPRGAKPEFRRNQYGFVLGGPIQKNKTFFFTDWQGTRLRTALTRFSTVPTLGQRQGIFTTPVTNPATSQTFTTIPSDQIDPVAQQALQHYPAPNLPGAANNFVRTSVEPGNQDQFDVRMDRYFGDRHRVFGRYSFLRDEDTPRHAASRWERCPHIGCHRARRYERRRDCSILQLDAFPECVKSSAVWIYAAGSEPTISSERQHQCAGPSAELLFLDTSNCFGCRATADRANGRCE